MFFRFDGNEVRAIFTPRYRPMDNFEVLERLDRLGYKADTKVQCCLDAEFMSLSFPDSSRTFDLGGDRITPGLSICNSEVGLSSLQDRRFLSPAGLHKWTDCQDPDRRGLPAHLTEGPG